LRPEINSFLEQWSLEILDLADEHSKQVSYKRRLPLPVRFPRYCSIGESADLALAVDLVGGSALSKAEAEVREQHWHQAFMVAVRLLNVDITGQLLSATESSD